MMCEEESMKCEKCIRSYISRFDGILECDERSCVNGSKYEPLDIPVKWIYKQIQEHPGHLSSAWSRLIQMWREELLSSENPEKKEDKYVRMHEDPTAAQKFWRNE